MSTAFYAQTWLTAYAGILQSAPSHSNNITPQPSTLIIPTNLTAPQQELLCIHHRFGHVNFPKIQHWARQGLHGLAPHIARCPAPLCSACLYGSLKKRPHNHATGALTTTVSAPGKLVSVDQMVSGLGGHIPFHVDHASDWQYKHCTLWVDHYSRFLYSHLQESATIKETLVSKESFKNLASHYSIQV